MSAVAAHPPHSPQTISRCVYSVELCPRRPVDDRCSACRRFSRPLSTVIRSHTMTLQGFTTCMLVVTAGFSAARSGDWPAFRGPHGNGISDETGLPTEWGPDKNVKWKIDLPDDGNSSPIVIKRRVFVTCPEDNGKKRHLYCFDRMDGRQL